MTHPTLISTFLSKHRFALVGVSTRPDDFSRMVMKEMIGSGYEILPVRPDGDTIEGRPVYARLQDVPGKLDGAILMTSPKVTAEVVHDAHEAGVPRVWMHRGGGPGAVDEGAVDFCREHGIEVIAGECPLMFISPHTVHHVHAGTRRLVGHYPRAPLPAEPRARRLRGLAAHALLGWAACAAVMAVVQALLPLTIALLVHAVAAPVIFAPLAAHYARRHASPTPLGLAGIFVLTVAVLDALVIAGIVLGDFAMFGSVLGMWLPLALIFTASAIAAARVTPPAWRSPALAARA